MGDQAVTAGDTAESAMGDAGKGSFQQSQDKDRTERKTPGAPAAESRDEEWHDRLKDELTGGGGSDPAKKDAAGPGRGRF
jgi:cobalamin-dependent methionine synthase I